MTDAPKPPKRRSRKIIVAFVVLVLVSLVTWWYWPRGDARFVGKWRVVVVKAGQETETGEEWEFYRHGLAYQRVGQASFRSAMCWSIEGSELVLGVDWPAPNYGFQHWVRRMWNRMTGVAKPLHFEILKVTPDEIHTRFVARPDSGIGIFRRIPE